jgi:DNA-binding transcriptional LysR family regulator
MRLLDPSGRRIKLRDLQIMNVVIETHSISKAASRLSVSHPVVSKAISDLERTFGVKLFDRVARGVEPTRIGNALARRSISVFDELKQTVNEIAFLADPGAGELSIGASEPIAAGLLPAAMGVFLADHPRVRFKIEQGDAVTLQQRELRERTVEFVIARMMNAQPALDMKAEALFHERLCVVTGAKSGLARKRKIDLRDLGQERWIVAPMETLPNSPFVEAFAQIGMPAPTAVVEVYSFPMRWHLLAQGDFVTLVPATVLRFAPPFIPIKVLPVTLPAWRLPVAIITLKGRFLSPLAAAFLDRVRRISETVKK